MSRTSPLTYVQFSAFAVADSVHKSLPPDLAAFKDIEAIKAQVVQELHNQNLTCLTMQDWRPVREAAQNYDIRAGQISGSFSKAIAEVIRDWLHGRIPPKYLSDTKLEDLQEKEYPSYDLLSEFVNDKQTEILGHNHSIFEYTLDKLAEALLKNPVQPRFFVRFWTTAPKEYDFRGTTTRAQDEHTSDYGYKVVSRQVEISGSSQREAEVQAEHQKARYLSGLHAVGDVSQAESERDADAKSAKRKAQWDEEARKKAELAAWLQDDSRTAEEIRGREDEADQLGLMWEAGYKRGPYFGALAMAERRDKSRAEAKKKAEEEAEDRKAALLMIPKGAILRPIYQLSQAAARAIASDLLNSEVTEDEIREAVIGQVPPTSSWETRYLDVILLPGKKVYFYDGEKDEEGDFASEIGSVRRIPKDYALTNEETFGLLPKAMQEYLRRASGRQSDAEFLNQGWKDKISFFQDKEGKLFIWNSSYFAFDSPKDYIIFDEQGRRIPANSKRYKAFMEHK